MTHAVRRILAAGGVSHVVVVTPATHESDFDEALAEFDPTLVTRVGGGAERDLHPAGRGGDHRLRRFGGQAEALHRAAQRRDAQERIAAGYTPEEDPQARPRWPLDTTSPALLGAGKKGAKA